MVFVFNYSCKTVMHVQNEDYNSLRHNHQQHHEYENCPIPNAFTAQRSARAQGEEMTMQMFTTVRRQPFRPVSFHRKTPVVHDINAAGPSNKSFLAEASKCQ